MLHGPDFSSTDDEGLSDDNDYYEFKQRLKNKQKEAYKNKTESEFEQKRKKLQLIHSAVVHGHEEVIRTELDNGLNVDVDLENGWTPLLLAATTANEKILSELLKRGANVNQSKDGCTALMFVCNNRIEEETSEDKVLPCVKLLTDNGADVNAIDNKRINAFMLAAYNGHLETVKFLLPLTNKDAEDNQRWTALFWAADGNKPEVVDFLLKEGFTYDKVDIRKNSVIDIAHTNGYEEVLKLFPLDPLGDEFYLHLNNNRLNFEEIFSNLHNNEKPQFFSDICKMLYGMRSESLVSVFSDNNLDLSNFLSLNDSKLKDMGVRLPYQRRRIMEGLFKFHKHPFQTKSIPFIPKNELYTNIDVSSTVLSCVKQIIAMEASLKFIIANYDGKLDLSESQEVQPMLIKNRRQLKRLKIVTQQFYEKSKNWDLTLKPADRITRRRWNIPWSNLCLSVGIISLVIFFKLKL